MLSRGDRQAGRARRRLSAILPEPAAWCVRAVALLALLAAVAAREGWTALLARLDLWAGPLAALAWTLLACVCLRLEGARPAACPPLTIAGGDPSHEAS